MYRRILLVPIFISLSSTYSFTNTEQHCQCVPSNMCADDDTAVNGQGMFDIRMDNGLCQNYNEVCCETLVDTINSNSIPTPQNTLFKGCGFQNLNGIGARITSNSENSKFGELPWTLVILLRDVSKTERNMYKCGGSLIHPQVAITAAHCVFEVNHIHLTVRAGEWDTKSQDEFLPHQDRSVQEIILHPHFNSRSLKNDIALLVFDEAVAFADNVGVICLPPKGFVYDNIKCTASGWGKDAFKKGKHSSILKKVDLPIVPRDKCLTALRNTRLGAFYNLHRSFVCAGGEENKDTCKGDGGSPLVCPIPGHHNRFFQMGIVSWGIGCGENETPGVYVNVPLYSDWIDQQMFSKNFDSNMYRY